MWCFRRNKWKKELYEAMVDNLVLAEESNQALLAEVQGLKEERSNLAKAQAEETRNLKEQVTQLQMEKSALEKDFMDSTTLIQHQLDTTLQEKTSLQLSLQETTAELQTAKDEVQDLKEACARCVGMNKEVSNFSTILKEENQGLSTELQSVQQTLRTLEQRSEEDRQRKDSIMKDAEHYIAELETRMQDQEMHLRKGNYELELKLLRSQKEMEEFRENFVLKNSVIAEIEEEMIKCKAQEAETQKLRGQVTQLQMDKSALEKEFLDSTTLIQHQLDTTLQEKTSLQLSLQATTAELQTAKDEVQDLKEACARCVEMKEEVTKFSTILKEENQALSTELQSVQQTLKEENQALSTELQSVQQTLRTLEKRSEEDTRRKDSIMKEAGLYIDELKAEMEDQEMHLRKEMEEEINKCKKAQGLAQRSLSKALDENLRLTYELKKPSKQQIQDPEEDLAPHYPQKKWRRRPQKTDVYRPNQAPLVTARKN